MPFSALYIMLLLPPVTQQVPGLDAAKKPETLGPVASHQTFDASAQGQTKRRDPNSLADEVYWQNGLTMVSPSLPSIQFFPSSTSSSRINTDWYWRCKSELANDVHLEIEFDLQSANGGLSWHDMAIEIPAGHQSGVQPAYFGSFWACTGARILRFQYGDRIIIGDMGDQLNYTLAKQITNPSDAGTDHEGQTDFLELLRIAKLQRSQPMSQERAQSLDRVIAAVQARLGTKTADTTVGASTTGAAQTGTLGNANGGSTGVGTAGNANGSASSSRDSERHRAIVEEANRIRRENRAARKYYDHPLVNAPEPLTGYRLAAVKYEDSHDEDRVYLPSADGDYYYSIGMEERYQASLYKYSSQAEPIAQIKVSFELNNVKQRSLAIDDRYIYGFASGGLVAVDPSNGKTAKKFSGSGYGNRYVANVQLDPELGQIAVTYDNGHVKVWDTGTRKRLADIKPGESVMDTDFRGSVLACGTENGVVRFYSAKDKFKEVGSIQVDGVVTNVRLDPSGDEVCVTSSRPNQTKTLLSLYDVSGGAPLCTQEFRLSEFAGQRIMRPLFLVGLGGFLFTTGDHFYLVDVGTGEIKPYSGGGPLFEASSSQNEKMIVFSENRNGWDHWPLHYVLVKRN